MFPVIDGPMSESWSVRVLVRVRSDSELSEVRVSGHLAIKSLSRASRVMTGLVPVGVWDMV